MSGPLILSVFPGIDLLGRAFEEVWPECCVVRGPDLLWGGDIRTFHPPAGRFDGAIGGPPCQTFSPLAHLVRANGHEPRFGNLIPEFERVVIEARPSWFVMENVPPAPLPSILGYGITAFRLCPTAIAAEDGFGHAQRRSRRFSFGLLGRAAPDLRQWIAYAALELCEIAPTVSRGPVIDNSPEAKGRSKERTVLVGDPAPSQRRPERVKRYAVTSKGDEIPVKMNAGGKVKKGTVVAGHGPIDRSQLYGRRYTIAEASQLQGLPDDFLADAPFTSDGKRSVIGNGVPMAMGRAVATAVMRAVESTR